MTDDERYATDIGLALLQLPSNMALYRHNGGMWQAAPAVYGIETNFRSVAGSTYKMKNSGQKTDVLKALQAVIDD